MRKIGIIAYGSQEDREKLAKLSTVLNKSASQIIIDEINKLYHKMFSEK